MRGWVNRKRRDFIKGNLENTYGSLSSWVQARANNLLEAELQDDHQVGHILGEVNSEEESIAVLLTSKHLLANVVRSTECAYGGYLAADGSHSVCWNG